MLHGLIDAIERARDSVITAVKDLRPDQATLKPSPETWSIAENVEHLDLAEVSGVTKIWAAANQVRSGSRWSDARPNDGQSIETVGANSYMFLFRFANALYVHLNLGDD